MGNKIVVIGSSNVDLIMKMDRLPKIGETVTDATFRQVYGGKGANQAVAAARAGGDVVFINCVGNDAYTTRMIANFKRDGICTDFIFKEDQMVSGHALVMVGETGENYLSVAPGANYALSPDHIRLAEIKLLDADIMILQNEIPEETIAYVLNFAQARQIPVLWNFAPAQPFPIAMCQQVDILVVNETEASFLTNLKVHDVESGKIGVVKLTELGPRLALLTLGDKGVLYHEKGSKDIHHQSAFKVQARDTTGAGDVFCGSFAIAYAKGKTLEQSIRFANAAAALCVQKIGAQPSIPNGQEIDEFVTQNQLA